MNDDNFITISTVEFEGLKRARAERDMLSRLLNDTERPDCTIKGRAMALVAAARLEGYSLTIEEVPLYPLRMGNKRTVVNVHPIHTRHEE